MRQASASSGGLRKASGHTIKARVHFLHNSFVSLASLQVKLALETLHQTPSAKWQEQTLLLHLASSLVDGLEQHSQAFWQRTCVKWKGN